MKLEFSAGGIVYQKDSGQNQNDILILVSQHSQHHGWVFPKGLIGDHVQNEGKEQTAIREVKEETGIVGKIIHELTPTVYWYEWQNEKRKKTVYYYMMEFVSGDTTDHDWEMEQVEWLPMDQVEKRLTYPSDKKVWQEAKKWLIEQRKIRQ